MSFDYFSVISPILVKFFITCETTDSLNLGAEFVISKISLAKLEESFPAENVAM